MSRVYWEGWFSGCYVKAEDWYKDNLVYVNVRIYRGSTAVDRPDIEKSFLLRESDGFPHRLANYRYSISEWLIGHEEKRDPSGKLIPITLSLPLMDQVFARQAEA